MKQELFSHLQARFWADAIDCREDMYEEILEKREGLPFEMVETADYDPLTGEMWLTCVPFTIH